MAVSMAGTSWSSWLLPMGHIVWEIHLSTHRNHISGWDSDSGGGGGGARELKTTKGHRSLSATSGLLVEHTPIFGKLLCFQIPPLPLLCLNQLCQETLQRRHLGRPHKGNAKALRGLDKSDVIITLTPEHRASAYNVQRDVHWVCCLLYHSPAIVLSAQSCHPPYEGRWCSMTCAKNIFLKFLFSSGNSRSTPINQPRECKMKFQLTVLDFHSINPLASDFTLPTGSPWRWTWWTSFTTTPPPVSSSSQRLPLSYLTVNRAQRLLIRCTWYSMAISHAR